MIRAGNIKAKINLASLIPLIKKINSGSKQNIAKTILNWTMMDIVNDKSSIPFSWFLE